MVEHPINHYTRNRNVEPNRQSPAGDAFVEVKAFPPGAIERGEDQGDDDDRENRMRAKQGEIKCANQTLPREACNTVVRVIPEVADKKERGRPESREHADFVRENALAADEKIAKRQQDRAGGV